MNMNSLEFIKLYDSIQPAELKSKDKRHASEEVRLAVSSALAPKSTDGISYVDLYKIQDALVYRSVLIADKDYKPYITFFNQINYYIGGGKDKRFVPWSNIDVWYQVIAALKSDPELSNLEVLEDSLEIQARMRVEAVSRIRNLGVQVKVIDDELVFDKVDKALDKLDKKVEKFGGYNLICILLRNLSYSDDFGRYIVERGGLENVIDFKNPNRDIPFNYLINLGFKHLSINLKEKISEQRYDEIIQIATDICVAIYNAQSFNKWDDVLQTRKSSVKYLQDLIYKTSLYDLPQGNKRFIYDWCKFVISEVNKEAKVSDPLKKELKMFTFSMDIAYKCLQKDRVVVMESGNTNPFIYKSLSDFCTKYCTNVSNLNSGFSEPSDFDHVDYWKYPMVSSPIGVILFPETLGAWAWYEIMMTIIRTSFKGIDNMVGIYQERFIHKEFQKKGMLTKSGDYNFEYEDATTGKKLKEHGECDILLESKDGIALFECKKKPLTRAAKSGYLYKGIIDIAESLLASQTQAFRTAATLRQDGKVELIDKKGNLVDTVEFHDRRVKKVSLVLTDYGIIQDAVFAHQILKIFSTNEFGLILTAPIFASLSAKEKQNLEKKYNEINLMMKKLINYADKDSDKDIFFDSTFLNIEQLTYLIRHCKDSEVFFEHSLSNCANTLSYDFWTERKRLAGIL